MVSFRTLSVVNNSTCRSYCGRAVRKQMDVIPEHVVSALCPHVAPPLSGGRHKGQSGRIGVIGGSLEYTGAPYFAGISALKVGADLTHVFCTESAAPVIKSYSPELIVHPLLSPATIDQALPWIDRLHVVVVGPGLGREQQTFDAVTAMIEECRKLQKPLVIDADGLFLITKNPGLIADYPAAVVLTPNAIEFKRLFQDEDLFPGMLDPFGSKCMVVRKGGTDEIFNSKKKVSCTIAGSGRRCGGQGDLLSGSLATFLCWALNTDTSAITHDMRVSVACYAACRLTRECNARAFAKHGRSMTCTDMIAEIGGVFNDLFENK